MVCSQLGLYCVTSCLADPTVYLQVGGGFGILLGSLYGRRAHSCSQWSPKFLRVGGGFAEGPVDSLRSSALGETYYTFIGQLRPSGRVAKPPASPLRYSRWLYGWLKLPWGAEDAQVGGSGDQCSHWLLRLSV